MKTYDYINRVVITLSLCWGSLQKLKNFYASPRSMYGETSNERGEFHPRTLVDRKWKGYDNAVDVVVRLHDRPILVPNVRHLRNLHTFSS